ncbi:2Fe-2S iron-sulfur cluster binding domain-containing protein [Nonomuraea sp. MG754425]|uniref:2Fe-2S iron-sulfur cluster-binding protein n=1 Tax=Nonomuraea sp. MG754425 TaxID=2570319 RepID=UPI001F01F04B|nr:2Fe-2S iron-sulfur cluster-binding protein [Nonomuraea sp. MG754425]MCF6469971.1 2Fe-2S iron-sulfur cluster binding domain-containing protein [Nonomuraea sp. MG754425]
MTATAPTRARLRFHPLTVAGVRTVAPDGSAVAITLDVPGELREEFAFRPGQHVTVRATPAGGRGAVRRAYSLCSTPADLAGQGTLTIGVRLVPGGAFSSHAHRALRQDDVLDVLPPVGSFSTDLDPARARRYGAIAGGSGITPVLSLARAALAAEPRSTFTLVYANRGVDSMMFAEELSDLKNRHVGRLQLVHAFSREDPRLGLPGGRLDAAALTSLIGTLLPPAAPAGEWFVCGPPGLVRAGEQALAGREAVVRTELFHTGAPAPPPPPLPADGRERRLEVVMDGRTTTVNVRDGQSLLDAALAARPELPYSCRNGVCATCRALVTGGRARTSGDRALSPREQAAGYVLTCRATPVTDHVKVDFDAV